MIYLVTIPIAGCLYVEVEAGSIEEAKARAIEKADNGEAYDTMSYELLNSPKITVIEVRG